MRHINQSGIINTFIGKSLLIMMLVVVPNQVFSQVNQVNEVSDANIEQLEASCSEGESDYFIYLRWSNLKNPCITFKSSSLKIERGDEYGQIIETVYTISGPAGSHSENDYPDAVGPNRSHPYRFTANYSGDLGLCTGYSRTAAWGSTERLRPPRNVTATDSLYDNKVKVSWDASNTHVPDGEYYYRVYRDGIRIATLAYNVLEYNDSNVEPGKICTYAVETYYAGETSIVGEDQEDEGSAHDLNVRTSLDETGVLVVEWDWPATVEEIPSGFDVFRRAGSGTPVPIANLGPTARGHRDTDDPVPGFSYQYIVEPYKITDGSIYYFRSDSALGGIPPNGYIDGYVRTRIDPLTGKSGPVLDVQVCAERSGEDDIPQGEDTIYCALTNAQGYYKIDSIYYYTGASFEIRPYKENHVFVEEMEIRTLRLDDYQIGPIDFTDESTFTVSGRVYQVFGGDTCGVKNAEVLVDTISYGWITDSAGYYNLTVDLIKEYSFKPSHAGHGFRPGTTDTLVADNVAGLDFEDTTRYALSGSVAGPCNTFIGVAELRIRSLGGNHCFEATVMSDTEGKFEIDLPGRRYSVDVTGIDPHDDAIINYFEPDTIDLTSGPAVKNFVYRTPPVIRLSQLPAEGGGEFQVPIWKQHIYGEVKIEVLDIYGDSTCPVKEGYLVINDEVSDNRTEPVTLSLDSAGTAYYPMMPGRPNIHAIPANHPYQKRLHVSAHAGQETSSIEQYVLVTGHSPRTPEFYNTSPELVHWVLRDPPGDKSFSILEKDSTLSTFISSELLITDGAGFHVDVQLGVIASVGVSIGAEVSFEVGGYYYGQYDGFWVDETNVIEGKQVNLTTKEEFKTSDGEKVLGDDGDVFIGATYTMVYGLTDAIDFDWTDNQVVKDTLIAWDIDSINSTFMYTESHIRNHIIPELEFLLTQSDSAKARQFQEDIARWQYELFFNDSLKQAAVFSENIDFSGGVGYNYTTTIDSMQAYTKSVKQSYDSQWEIGHGEVVSGCAFNVGYKGSYYKHYVKDTIQEASFSLTTGFHLEDDDPEDEFSVSVKKDPHYGTPVFELFSGTSSCPWEKGTQAHDGVAMSLDTYEQLVPADQNAQFKLYLVNASESGAYRDYLLSLVQASNPEGAIIEVSGNVLGDDELKFNEMPPNSEDPQQQMVRVRRAEGSSFIYDDLQLQFYSACDPQIRTSVIFDVHFQNACSHVTIDKPGNNWIIGNKDGDTLIIVLRDYDPSDSKISKMGLQYREKGSISWRDVFSVDAAFLPPDSTRYYWDISDLSDGQYELRASIHCGDGFYYTPQISGIIDHSEFTLEGTPQPADGLYGAGDEISFTYNADIDPATTTRDHVKLLRLNDETEVNIDIECIENKLILHPGPEVGLTGGERLMALVFDVADLDGHCMQFPVSWEFKVAQSGTAIPEQPASPSFFLGQNYPNPFRVETMITYFIPEEGDVRLSVFDLNGQEVLRLVDVRQTPGLYTVPVKSGLLDSGVYIYRIQTERYAGSRKMIVY